MTAAAVLAPTTAERILSACARASGAILAVDGMADGGGVLGSVPPVTTGLHHLLGDGSFAVTVPVDSPTAAAVQRAGVSGTPALLELTDYAPLPLREPVRSLVWTRGWLQHVPLRQAGDVLDLVATHNPDPTLLEVRRPGNPAGGLALLRLEVDSVVVADSTGAESVSVGTLLAAEPDPFCEMESCWLQHIDADHTDVVARLASKLPAPLQRGRVRPLGIDRYGVRLRVESDCGDHDVRLPFTQPVDDVTGLSRAIRILMGCPFLNGLRARRL